MMTILLKYFKIFQRKITRRSERFITVLFVFWKQETFRRPEQDVGDENVSVFFFIFFLVKVHWETYTSTHQTQDLNVRLIVVKWERIQQLN